MAVDTSFRVVTQYPSVEFLGGTKTQDVVAVGFVTSGHNVYAEVRIPQKDYSASLVKATCLSYTDIYETLFTEPGVTGVEWSQATNASGLLIDQVVITVSSTSGNSSAQLAPIPLTALGPEMHKPQIEHLRTELDDAEAAT